jgi:hypothetical protein
MATTTLDPLPCSNNDGVDISDYHSHGKSNSNQLCKK